MTETFTRPWKTLAGVLALVAALTLMAGQALAETDVTAKVLVVKGTLGYDRLNKQSYLNVSVKNISTDVLLDQVKVVIDSVTPSAVTLVNADGMTSDGKPYVLYKPLQEAFQPGESILEKRWSFANPKAVRFSYSTKVIGTISTPAAAIEKATSALTEHNVPAFLSTVPADEQPVMGKKLDLLEGDAPAVMQTLSGLLANATVVEETATSRKMRTLVPQPDGSTDEVFFEMVLENGIWRLRGL